MSILKMKFVSIVGLNEYFDDFVLKYIVDSGMQLENALSYLETVKGLTPYDGNNPYYDLVTRSTALVNAMGLKKELKESTDSTRQIYDSADEIRSDIAKLEEEYRGHSEHLEKTKEMLNKCIHMEKQLELLANIDVDIKAFFNFEFIKFRFGKMPRKSYEQLQLMSNDLEAIAIPVSQEKDFIWLIYFTPRNFSEKVDGIFSSLYFERTRISDEVQGTPSEALRQVRDKITSLRSEMKDAEKAIRDFTSKHREKAINLYYSSMRLNRVSEVRKYAAHTMKSFYIIGWMPEKELNRLIPILDKDEKIIYIHKEPDTEKLSHPPTELKNNRIFRPFETLVRMYGLPSYNEVDPTPFVALTYFLMFGFMFGDVGQGLVILAGGIFMLFKLKIAFGGVILGAGISSTLFGFVYGSVFGFEDWLPPLWMNPMHDINTMLIAGIGMGMALIIVAMVLNIVNGIKAHDLARIFLDKNGIPGFVFYLGGIVSVVYFYLNNKLMVSAGITAAILLIPILLMFFKEPIENFIHKRKAIAQSKGVFFVQTFFELFDVVLSFLSNTISFIRLSAFALNHVGLFMAVFILAEMASGFGSIAAIIIGNILIIGLEGLIVGIQGLRLEYYELFSRFFTGNGKPYKPLKKQYFS